MTRQKKDRTLTTPTRQAKNRAAAFHILEDHAGGYAAGVDRFSETATLCEDLGYDSLDFVEVVMSLEEEFKIEIEDADAERWKTVGDVLDYIERATA